MYGLPLWIWWTAAGLCATLGLILITRALFLDRPRGRKRCPKCWYDLSGATRGPHGWTCPECGRLTTRDSRLHRTRRRKKLAALGLLLVLLLPTVWLTRYQHKHGWWAITPTPILMWIAVRQESRTSTRAQAHLLYERLPYYYRPGPIHDFLVSQAQARLGTECTMAQRYFGLGSLGILAARGKGLEALLTVAKGQDPDAADVALRCIKEARPPVDVVASLGRTMLTSRTPGVSSELFQLLAEYASEFSPEHADFFHAHALRMVKTDSNDIGAAAAHLLGRLQPLPDATIEQLMAILENAPRLPLGLADALASCGPRAADAVPILIRHAENGTSGNFATPVQVFGCLGICAASAIPTLDRITETSAYDRLAAQCARSVILGEQPSMVHAYLSSLDNPPNREQAVQNLGFLFFQCGQDIGIARPRIEQLLTDPDPKVRRIAANFMMWIEDKAAPSLPALRAAKSDPDPDVRHAATYAIRQIERAIYLMPRATSPRTPPP